MIEISTGAAWGLGLPLAFILVTWLVGLYEKIDEHRSEAKLYGQRLADVFTLDPSLVAPLEVSGRGYWDHKTITIKGLRKVIDLDHLGKLAESKRNVRDVEREMEEVADFERTLKEARK